MFEVLNSQTTGGDSLINIEVTYTVMERLEIRHTF